MQSPDVAKDVKPLEPPEELPLARSTLPDIEETEGPQGSEGTEGTEGTEQVEPLPPPPTKRGPKAAEGTRTTQNARKYARVVCAKCGQSGTRNHISYRHQCAVPKVHPQATSVYQRKTRPKDSPAAEEPVQSRHDVFEARRALYQSWLA